MAERKRLFKGTSETCALRRRDLIEAYLSFLSSTVECLVSHSFRNFMDMREDLLDRRALAGEGGGRFLGTLSGMDGQPLVLEDSPVKGVGRGVARLQAEVREGARASGRDFARDE